ncbi:hypothetical protein B0I32_12348 [Nonomuraea fuscirosea]|uniref:Uncharacterized protein n=1 Tax=Nonomuraea fuscirosea TaxID=1291556 RepID=A0A2T0ML80_9ACTN|nr:hypothetical protein B0I32_12348 [Nonomuraea fuscirosea]
MSLSRLLARITRGAVALARAAMRRPGLGRRARQASGAICAMGFDRSASTSAATCSPPSVTST